MIAVTITAMNAKNSGMLYGASTMLTAVTIATQPMSTTHPCHVAGGPHPQPYRFAGNQ